MSGEVTPGNLNIGKWLDQLGSHSDPIYSKLRSQKSLYSIFDSQIESIYVKCVASPGTTVGDANLSGDESIMREFSQKMDSATKKATEELDALANELDEEIAKKESNKDESSFSLLTEDNNPGEFSCLA